jgi:uncharacterized protein (DUF1778 family)
MSKPHDNECLCDDCCKWYLNKNKNITKLSPRDSKVIMDLLNDPNPKPNEALKRVVERYNQYFKDL